MNEPRNSSRFQVLEQVTASILFLVLLALAYLLLAAYFPDRAWVEHLDLQVVLLLLLLTIAVALVGTVAILHTKPDSFDDSPR